MSETLGLFIITTLFVFGVLIGASLMCVKKVAQGLPVFMSGLTAGLVISFSYGCKLGMLLSFIFGISTGILIFFIYECIINLRKVSDETKLD